MLEPLPQEYGTNVHVISNQEGQTFDTFAYNTLTHDSVYYAYDPQQSFGRRSLSSATDGALDHTVSLFEDGTATVGFGLKVNGEKISGSAVTIDPEGELRVLINGDLRLQITLAQDPQLDVIVEEGLLTRKAADDLLNAFQWGDLTHLSCVQRGFPNKRAGTDGASYHVPPHIMTEMDSLILEAGATPRPMLPLLIMPVTIHR